LVVSLSPRALLIALLLVVPRLLPAQGKVEISVPLPELEKRVHADSNDAAAHYNVAIGYWSAKRWDEADRELRKAVALQPRFAEPHLALAYLPQVRDPHMFDPYRDQGRIPISSLPEKIQDAIKQNRDEYRWAFMMDPMVDLRMIAASSNGMDYRLQDALFGSWIGKYFAGRDECAAGKYAECENTLTLVIDEIGKIAKKGDPVPTDAYWYRGLAAAHVKHFDAAIADFNKLISRDEAMVKKVEEKGLIRAPMQTNEYRYFLALFLQAGGKTEEAILTYRKAIENDLGLYMAHVRLADIYEGRKELPKAIEERRNAISANPDDPSLQMDLGVTLGKAGDFAGAETALKAATDGLPRDFSAWYWLGIAEQQLGQKAAAKDAFQRVVALAPSRVAELTAKANQHLATLQ
jgi:tetratricopeptide (TPR) repeat protein